MAEPLLVVENLQTWLDTGWGVAKAVDGVSFTIGAGETFGLVGESGCGKTMTALSILQLVPKPAGRIVGGSIRFEGQNLLEKSPAEMRKVRGESISMILQDPITALNPVFTIGNQLMEGIAIHQHLRGRPLWERGVQLLDQVRIASPEHRMGNYPHELSGGMRQRVVGAISISCQPKLIIADEATTALDTTVQAQYLELLKDIQRERGLSILFITHDFGIVAVMCDRVGVMYAGKMVETATTREIFDAPQHPYTEALLRSIPVKDRKIERLIPIEGHPPALYDLPTGCSFHPRCTLNKDERCTRETPPLRESRDHHWVACWKR